MWLRSDSGLTRCLVGTTRRLDSAGLLGCFGLAGYPCSIRANPALMWPLPQGSWVLTWSLRTLKVQKQKLSSLFRV